jgi:hypothetical protein
MIELLGAATFWWAATAGAGGTPTSRVEVTVVREHSKLALAAHDRLAQKVVRLLESCSVNSTTYAHPEALWERGRASPNFVHLRFAKSRELQVMSVGNQGFEARAVDEILLPLPRGAWPDHVVVKAQGGTFSFTKYTPQALGALVSEPALGLSRSSPYDSLLKRE